MNINDVLAQNGLEFHDSEQAVAELAELDNDELWTITEQLMGDDPIGIQGDEDEQADILRIVIANAFDNGAESITQDDIDLAQETALNLQADQADQADVEDEPSGVSVTEEAAAIVDGQTDEEPEQEASEDESEPVDAKPKRTRKRTSESRRIIKNLVIADPDMPRDEVLAQAESEGIDVSPDTAMMYFYDVRNELGLAPNGKRGRKKTNTIERVIELIQANPDLSRKEYIGLIHSELGYAESSASVYYHKAQNEMQEA